MFENLSGRLQQVVKTLRGQARLSEENISDAMREVRMALLDEQQAMPHAGLKATPATNDEVEMFYRHLEQTLTDIGFLNPHSPRRLMQRLRRMYARTALEKEEVNILRGILTLTQHPRPPEE